MTATVPQFPPRLRLITGTERRAVDSAGNTARAALAGNKQAKETLRILSECRGEPRIAAMYQRLYVAVCGNAPSDTEMPA